MTVHAGTEVHGRAARGDPRRGPARSSPSRATTAPRPRRSHAGPASRSPTCSASSARRRTCSSRSTPGASARRSRSSSGPPRASAARRRCRRSARPIASCWPVTGRTCGPDAGLRRLRRPRDLRGRAQRLRRPRHLRRAGLRRRPGTVARFFAKGMLMNVLASMHLNDPTEPWAPAPARRAARSRSVHVVFPEEGSDDSQTRT